MSCPRCPNLTRLSCPGCPVPAVLFQVPCPGHLVHCTPDTTIMSWQPCHLCPFQVHLFRLTCWAELLRMSCPDCFVPIVHSRMSGSGCLVQVTLSQRSSLSCHSCSIPDFLSYSSSPVLAVMFWPFCLFFLSWLYCPVFLPDFPVTILLSRLSCLSCPVLVVLYGCLVPAILSNLSYTSCPVPAIPSRLSRPAVLSLLSCSSCPVPAVLSQLLFPDTLIHSSLDSAVMAPGSPV
jgi:hypothetical protein